MSRGVNKAILIGRLGKDPETRYTPSGNAVTNCSIATSEQWKDKNTGEKQERAEWHNLVFFNRLAEIAGEYLKKGAMIYVEGSIRTRKWQDQSGVDRYTTEIVVSELQMLGDSGQRNDSQPQQLTQPQQAPQQPQQAPQQPPAAQPPADFDDDIPF